MKILFWALSWAMATSALGAELDRSVLVKFSDQAQAFYKRARHGMVQDAQTERKAFDLSLVTQVLLREWDAPSAPDKRAQIQTIISYLRPHLDELSDALSKAQNGGDLESDLKMLTTFVDLIESSDVPLVNRVAGPSSSNAAPNFAGNTTWGATFVTIPAGTFVMGSPSSEANRDADETPHSVTISQSFEMQTTEVTQAQWKGIMGSNPSLFLGEDYPVGGVSWNNTQKFIDKLNLLDSAYTYRLPTEAEWEYAARGGTKTAYFFGDNLALIRDYAWFGYTTRPVGQTLPNSYGLYDMCGNAGEWVGDWYDQYPNQAVTDPQGPASGISRVYRGGGAGPSSLRSADRGEYPPTYTLGYLSFRLVRTKR